MFSYYLFKFNSARLHVYQAPDLISPLYRLGNSVADSYGRMTFNVYNCIVILKWPDPIRQDILNVSIYALIHYFSIHVLMTFPKIHGICVKI